MFRIRTFMCLVFLLCSAPEAAFAYGMSLQSPGGINMDSRMEGYEVATLNKVAECAKGLNIPPESRFELVLGLDGKPISASFVATSLEANAAKTFIESVKSQSFGQIPGLEGDPRLTLTFSIGEICNPPFNRNSIRISGGGGTRITGGTITDGAANDPRTMARSFELQKQALESQSLSTPKEKEENVRSYLRLARTALAPSYVDVNTMTPLPRADQTATVQKCYQAAMKTLATMDASEQVGLVTDLAQLSSKLAQANILDTADSAIRKAIDIEQSNKGANPFGSRIIDKSLTRVVDQYRNTKQYPKGIALLKYRIDRLEFASATTPGAVCKFQDELASLLLINSVKVPAQRAQLFEESKRVSKDALAGISKNFGPQSGELIRAIRRRVNDLNAAGQPAAAQALLKEMPIPVNKTPVPNPQSAPLPYIPGTERI